MARLKADDRIGDVPLARPCHVGASSGPGWAPKAELSRYAYAWPDLNALGRVADRLRAARNRKCIWGPSRHGPGNNHFLYLHDEDGVMIDACSGLAQMQADGYEPKTWSMHPRHHQPVGRPAAAAFLLTGFPIATPTAGRPAWAMKPGRTQSDLALVDLRRGELERSGCAVGGEDRVQPQTPEESGMAGPVSVVGGVTQRRALGGLPASGALDRG